MTHHRVLFNFLFRIWLRDIIRVLCIEVLIDSLLNVYIQFFLKLNFGVGLFK